MPQLNYKQTKANCPGFNSTDSNVAESKDWGTKQTAVATSASETAFVSRQRPRNKERKNIRCWAVDFN
jgi:hypothetical protein